MRCVLFYEIVDRVAKQVRYRVLTVSSGVLGIVIAIVVLRLSTCVVLTSFSVY